LYVIADIDGDWTAQSQIIEDLMADVAELADALDSKFHFRCFQKVSPCFNQSDYTPYFIG
jgi:hypothetical protein